MLGLSVNVRPYTPAFTLISQHRPTNDLIVFSLKKVCFKITRRQKLKI